MAMHNNMDTDISAVLIVLAIFGMGIIIGIFLGEHKEAKTEPIHYIADNFWFENTSGRLWVAIPSNQTLMAFECPSYFVKGIDYECRCNYKR